MRTLAKLVCKTNEYLENDYESCSLFVKKLAILNPDVEMLHWYFVQLIKN
nr:hypothetical protein [Mycoplasmopsis bovis]